MMYNNRVDTQGLDFMKGYMRRAAPRRALSDLARETFGLDLDGWARAGYCGDHYVPYTFFRGGRAMANVSANVLDFTLRGEVVRLVQLGTVMTAVDMRGRGLAKELMARVIADYRTQAADIYLLANDASRGFYEKRGLRKGRQYRFSARYGGAGGARFEKVSPGDAAARAHYLRALRACAPNAALALHNFGLMAYWTADMEDAYYCAALDCYAMAQARDGTLYLNDVICPRDIDLWSVIDGLPLAFTRVTLGFTPLADARGLFAAEEWREEDSNLFHLGDFLDCMARDRLMFPVYSNA